MSGIRNSELNNFIKKLFIYDAGYNLIRMWKKKDGDYLIPDILNKINYCFSPRVGLSTDFEDHLKKKKFYLFLPIEQ